MCQSWLKVTYESGVLKFYIPHQPTNLSSVCVYVRASPSTIYDVSIAHSGGASLTNNRLWWGPCEVRENIWHQFTIRGCIDWNGEGSPQPVLQLRWVHLFLVIKVYQLHIKKDKTPSSYFLDSWAPHHPQVKEPGVNMRQQYLFQPTNPKASRSYHELIQVSALRWHSGVLLRLVRQHLPVHDIGTAVSISCWTWEPNGWGIREHTTVLSATVPKPGTPQTAGQTIDTQQDISKLCKKLPSTQRTILGPGRIGRRPRHLTSAPHMPM